MTVVIIQRGSPQNPSEVRHHVIASRDVSTAPEFEIPTRGTGRERFHPDLLIENWGTKLDECQEIKHPVGEGQSPGMQECLDGAACLPVTYIRGHS